MTSTRTSRPVQRFHWADALNCDVSSSVVMRGRQTSSVQTGEDGTGPHIAVVIGRVLIYLYDEDAVRSHASAWQKAASIAEGAFGDNHHSPKPRNADDRDRSLALATVVVQCARTQRPSRADGATTAAAGHPYVQVQVGRLTIVCLDRPAVETLAGAWREAVELARTQFPDPDEVAHQRRTVAAFERSGRPQPAAPFPEQTKPEAAADANTTAARLEALETRVGKLERRKSGTGGLT